MKNNKTTDELWRLFFTQRVDGLEFDKPGGGYSFSAVLAEEEELDRSNIAGNKSSALLKLSVADPTWKMTENALLAGLDYFRVDPDASRYKDIRGVRKTPGTIMTADTHEMLADLIQKRYGVVTEDGKGLTADWVQHSPGSIKRALADYLPTLLFEERVNLLFPSPGYLVIGSKMNRRHVNFVDVPLVRQRGRWELDMDKLTEIVTNSISFGIRSVMYCNVPHNPTGMGYTRYQWELLIAWAIEHKVTLVVDEAYIDLRYRNDIFSVLEVPGWEKCSIVLQSVSKGWNATGLRFGWIIAHPTVIKALRKVMDVKDSGMFGPSIVAGIYCLSHPSIALETSTKYHNLHRTLALGLEEAGFAGGMPDAGLCQFAPAPKAVSGNAFFAHFKDAAECAMWLRQTLRISVMHAKAADGQWLRWAATLKPIPECGLATDEAVIAETVRRLKSVQFKF